MTGARHAGLSRLWGRLYGYALSLVSDEERACDLVQETAVRALRARRVPSDEAAYRAWLFVILRNVVLDELRRSRREPEPPPPAVDIWRSDETRIAKITVEQALSALPMHQRDVIALVDIAGFSYSEAASLLEVPVGTVMSRVARARRALLSIIDSSTVHPLHRRHGK